MKNASTFGRAAWGCCASKGWPGQEGLLQRSRSPIRFAPHDATYYIRADRPSHRPRSSVWPPRSLLEVGAEVGVTDGPKGVVVNTRNGKAYAAFPDLGIVKIVTGAGPVVTLKTGANVKNLTLDPRSGWVRDEPRAPDHLGHRSGTDAIVDTLEADRGQSDGAQSRHEQAVRRPAPARILP